MSLVEKCSFISNSENNTLIVCFSLLYSVRMFCLCILETPPGEYRMVMVAFFCLAETGFMQTDNKSFRPINHEFWQHGPYFVEMCTTNVFKRVVFLYLTFGHRFTNTLNYKFIYYYVSNQTMTTTDVIFLCSNRHKGLFCTLFGLRI